MERVSFFDPICCFFKCYLLLEAPLSGKRNSNILILLRPQPKPHQQVLEHPGRQPSDPAVAEVVDEDVAGDADDQDLLLLDQAEVGEGGQGEGDASGARIKFLQRC